VRAKRNNGFTLIELVIVMGLILLIMSLAMPALMPAFAFSELEGAARHVAAYGRSASAYAGFQSEYIAIKIDLDAGEYWAIQVLDTTQQLFDDEEPETEETEQEALAALVASQAEGGVEGISEEALQMQEQFERFFRRTVEAQTKNVQHDGRLFGDKAPLFEKDFELREEEDDEDRIISDILLQKTRLPNDVYFDSVVVGTARHQKGIVEIDVSPLGLTDTVTFYLVSGGDQYFTVVWDPITGSSRMARGKQAVEAAEDVMEDAS
jgi:prepilin-type N-terminal cleavage/methylation domain-containing protein